MSWFGVKTDWQNALLFKDGNQNQLVNFKHAVAKDRGIDFIIVNATTIEEEVTLEFVSEVWIESDFWEIFVGVLIFLTSLMFMFQFS
jgi:hypothetical protein